MGPDGRAHGVGRRKRSIARVWIREGTGEVKVNRQLLVHYFTVRQQRFMALEPFFVTDTAGKFDVSISVNGGGINGTLCTLPALPPPPHVPTGLRIFFFFCLFVYLLRVQDKQRQRDWVWPARCRTSCRSCAVRCERVRAAAAAARQCQNRLTCARVRAIAGEFLTRDARRVERKKPGQKKARKKTQWVKR